MPVVRTLSKNEGNEDLIMNIKAIRSDVLYRRMAAASEKDKETIYRYELMKPFAYKWNCIGIPLQAEDGGCFWSYIFFLDINNPPTMEESTNQLNHITNRVRVKSSNTNLKGEIRIN